MTVLLLKRFGDGVSYLKIGGKNYEPKTTKHTTKIPKNG